MPSEREEEENKKEEAKSERGKKKEKNYPPLFLSFKARPLKSTRGGLSPSLCDGPRGLFVVVAADAAGVGPRRRRGSGQEGGGDAFE